MGTPAAPEKGLSDKAQPLTVWSLPQDPFCGCPQWPPPHLQPQGAMAVFSLCITAGHTPSCPLCPLRAVSACSWPARGWAPAPQLCLPWIVLSRDGSDFPQTAGQKAAWNSLGHQCAPCTEEPLGGLREGDLVFFPGAPVESVPDCGSGPAVCSACLPRGDGGA